MKGIAFRHVANPSPNFVGLRKHIVPRDAHAAGGGWQIAGENAHDGALARPVWPEQTDDLPPAHREGNGAHRRVPRVALGHVLNPNHQSVTHAPNLSLL